MELRKEKLTWPQLEELFPDPAEAPKSRKFKTNSEVKNKGISLTWSDLSVYAKLYHKKFLGPTKISYKKLVNNVSGAVEAGKLVAIMGPSGAGKSTILYALANRLSGGMLVDGDIRINGTPVDRSMCKISGFMRQEDLFISDLTVKEHLAFMARLKLDRRLSSKERDARVDSLIQDLGLSHCSHRKIGGSTFGDMTELSGGERKRLSFATACLPDPPLLFCDEPTTGLDSLNAIRIVSRMASWGATILCSIHQPSPEILNYFSSLILVAEGSLVFSGTLDNGVEFFKSLGYEQKEDKSGGEFLVSCLAPIPGAEATSSLAVKRIVYQFGLSDFVKTSEMHIQLSRQSVQMNENNLALHDHHCLRDGDGTNLAWKTPLSGAKAWMPPAKCCLQDSDDSADVFTLSCWRHLMSGQVLASSPHISLGPLMYWWFKRNWILVVGLTSGLCYVGTISQDQAGLQNVQGALFVLVAENTFVPMYSALAIFPKELPLLLREMRDGDYHPSALYLAKILSVIPGLTLEAILFTSIVYWLANLRDTVFAFFMVLVFNILCVLVSSACGMMFANIFETYEQANTFLIPFDNLMMFLSGVYIKLSSLPKGLSWLQDLSWLMYTYESMTILQWQGVKDLYCSEVNYLPCLKSDNEIFEYYSFSENNLYTNLISLTVLYFCFHIISYVFFVRKIRKHV